MISCRPQAEVYVFADHNVNLPRVCGRNFSVDVLDSILTLLSACRGFHTSLLAGHKVACRCTAPAAEASPSALSSRHIHSQQLSRRLPGRSNKAPSLPTPL